MIIIKNNLLYYLKKILSLFYSNKNKENIVNLNKLDLNKKFSTYFKTVVDFENFVDNISKYFIYKNMLCLDDISKMNKKYDIKLFQFYTNNGYYLENIDEINTRLLEKINKIKKDFKELDTYHSRSLQSHIMYLEDYINIFL